VRKASRLGPAAWLLLALGAWAGSAQAAPVYKYTDAQGVVTYTDRAHRGAQVLLLPEYAPRRLATQARLGSLPSPGRTTAGARPYAYPLPWRGGPFYLSQGPSGQFSHFGIKSRYAVDIAMPRGTPIVAARSGTVVGVENGQAEGGSEPSGNFVRVLHDDGTMGVYLHLSQASVRVWEGQSVKVGTLLAQSGNTGHSTGPHLHFVVQRQIGSNLESIPFEFRQPVGALPNFALGSP
jgi:murein DD-endopeptidase MepM/ murein hydrolase activator NlpD